MLGNVIEVTILTGKGKGETVFIPWIPLTPTDLPFNFKRLQFPVRLAFAIMTNKSQGQSIKYCGVDFRLPCFPHGQLYVACSRLLLEVKLKMFISGFELIKITVKDFTL
jgi:ATP-dependent DNA helicase PIF1